MKGRLSSDREGHRGYAGRNELGEHEGRDSSIEGGREEGEIRGGGNGGKRTGGDRCVAFFYMARVPSVTSVISTCCPDDVSS